MSYYLCGSLCRKYSDLSKPWNPFLKEVAMTSATMKVKLVNLLHLIAAWLLGLAFFAILLFPNKVFAQDVQVEVHAFSFSIILVVEKEDAALFEGLSPKMTEYCLAELESDREGEFIPFAKELLLCARTPHHLTFEPRQY